MLTYINTYIVDIVQAQTTDKNAEHVKILNSCDEVMFSIFD